MSILNILSLKQNHKGDKMETTESIILRDILDTLKEVFDETQRKVELRPSEENDDELPF